jgi:RNA recognition motif-containing protein
LGKKIYVGNLPFSATEDEIRGLFERHGSVTSVSLINDRETGRPRGFGFVEMDEAGADAAIQALDGKDFGGRSLRVNEAQDRRGGGGGSGGGGGRGGYGGGGGGRGGYGGGGGGYGGGGGGGGYGGGGGGGRRGGGW